jgi:TetR/AcrR family transcriptional regulator, transcriptional repressor for nem operon
MEGVPKACNGAMRITQEEAAENKAKIIAAAASRFREKGFDGISLADLLREVGLTHGGFYNHFRSKEELEAAACQLAFDKSASKLNAVYERPVAQRHARSWSMFQTIYRASREMPVWLVRSCR